MPSSGYRKQTMDFGEMSRDLQSAAASFTKMSAAAAGFVSLVGAFKTFELEVTRANSAIGGSAKVYKQLSDAARNFALVSKYSAGEAASSMVMLAQAGFDAQETIAAMPHVLQLAQASMENLDLVADTVASTIRTFNMSAEEASRVTNVFAASCVNSLATVNKLAFSFRQVGPVAAEMGMNIEETAAALDVLYNRGLRGEQAGTALRNILVRLIKPTQDTLNAFSLLGIGLKNADGSARGLQQILSDLKKANLDDAYLAKIFGREALAASKTLIAATTGEYDKMKDAITDTNTVARMANAQMNTLDGALKLIKNSLNEVGIILGQAVGPIIKQVSSYIQDFAIYLRTADSSTISLIKNLGSFVAILGSAKFGVGRLLTEMKSLALVGGKITSAFSALSSMLVFKQSGAGVMTLKNYADTLRMFEISQSGGTNWYTNVNEFYKSVNNGVGISMKAATEIKNLTTAQVAYMRAVIAGSAATKAFSTALKGLLVSSGKLLLVLAPLMLAFKMYDSYMKERERRQQLQSELFPELDYLDQKIKNLKLTVSNDLPALVNKYKEAMDLMSQAEETRQKASIQGVTVSDEGSTISKDTMLRLDKVASLMKEQLAKQGNFNEVDIRKLAAEIEAPFDLVETYLKGAKERLAQLAKEGKELSEDRRWLLVGRAGWDALQDYVRAAGNTIRGAQDQFNEAEKLSEQVVTDIIKSLQETNARLEWLIVKGTNKEQSDRIKKAFVSYILGMTYEDMDKALRENWDKVKEVINAHKDDFPAFLKDFRENFLNAEDQAQVVGAGTIDTEINAEVKISPVDTTQQEAALASLKKSVADMVSDYKISWELLTSEEYAKEKVARLDREISTNRVNTLAKQANLVKQLNNLYQTDETTWKKIKPLVEQTDKATGGLVAKNKLLASIYQNQDEEKRKQGALLVEQIDLTSKQLRQQDIALSKEKQRYELVNGRFKYEQEYLQDLSRRIADLDKQATTGASWDNFLNGMHSGFLGVEQQIDSVYQMGKKGMDGFANYLSDSMYDVIDNWDKGWISMREALRSTLIEMLKDTAKYFTKMAAYQAVMSTFGGLFGGATQGQQVYSAPIGPTQATSGFYGLPAAKGRAFDHGLQTFAKGGVVTQPTLFNHRTGKGLMGEAGPEAIMPLRRDSQGNLGVAMQGAGNNYSSTIIINAESGTAQVKSDADYNALAKSLDQQIRGVVLSTLVREKKPGGMLA